jgi:hypothetical protein
VGTQTEAIFAWSEVFTRGEGTPGGSRAVAGLVGLGSAPAYLNRLSQHSTNINTYGRMVRESFTITAGQPSV